MRWPADSSLKSSDPKKSIASSSGGQFMGSRCGVAVKEVGGNYEVRLGAWSLENEGDVEIAQ